MGGQQGWLKAHEISPEQTSMIEAAIGRITLRLIREGGARNTTLPQAPAPGRGSDPAGLPVVTPADLPVSVGPGFSTIYFMYHLEVA
jgi:hypothetical protein